MKKMLAVLLIMLLVAAVLPALDLESDSSPTNYATAGRFGTDFDNYMDVIGWSGLESNVLFLQFAGPEEDNDTTQFQVGTGYSLGNLYLGLFLGSAIPRTDADNISQVVSPSTIDDENGEIVFREETVDSTIVETRLQDTDFDVTVGYQMGDIFFGLNNELSRDQTNSVGTIDPGNGSWGAFGSGNVFGVNPLDGTPPTDVPTGFTSGATSTVTTKTDPRNGNTKTYEEATIYDDGGFINSNFLENHLELGAKLPVAMFDVSAILGIGFSAVNNDNEGSVREYVTDFEEELPDYEGVSNARSYTRETATETDSYNRLYPSLDVGLSMPLFENATVTFGLGYMLDTYPGDPRTWTWSEVDYSADPNGEYVDTTTVEENRSLEEDWSELGHEIEVPVGITVTPSEVFQYSVQYKPVFTTTTVEQNLSGSWTQVTTNTYGDPAQRDRVTTREGNIESATRTTNRQELKHHLDLGAQFYLHPKVRVNMGTAVSMSSHNQVSRTEEAGADNTYTETVKVGDNDAVTTEYDFETDLAANASDAEFMENRVMGGANVQYSLGMTYMFSETMELDLEYVDQNMGLTDQEETNIFNVGTWSAMMTIRY